MARRRSHKDVEFAVNTASGGQRTFRTFDEAAGFAVGLAVNKGSSVAVDVLVHSAAGARWWGIEEQYREDPDASVSDRIEITANHVGRVY